MGASGSSSRPLTLEGVRGQLKCDGTCVETRFILSAKQTSPFNSDGASVQSTTSSWDVRISGSNAGYTMFWGSGKSTGYPLHLQVSPSLPLPCVTVCHHISTGVYNWSHSLNLHYTSTVSKYLIHQLSIYKLSDINKENMECDLAHYILFCRDVVVCSG
jgi:hypothetical protein